MGTQVLAGSTGTYKPVSNISREFFGSTAFVVTADTCLEADKLPVKFLDAVEGCWISMSQVTFDSTIKTRDY